MRSKKSINTDPKLIAKKNIKYMTARKMGNASTRLRTTLSISLVKLLCLLNLFKRFSCNFIDELVTNIVRVELF